jgi:hypothetical protein
MSLIVVNVEGHLSCGMVLAIVEILMGRITGTARPAPLVSSVTDEPEAQKNEHLVSRCLISRLFDQQTYLYPD